MIAHSETKEGKKGRIFGGFTNIPWTSDYGDNGFK